MYFGLLMQALLHSNSTVVRQLRESAKNYDISKVSGENVDTVVSVLKSVCGRIWHARGQTFPDRFNLDILKVLQTSSCEDFNSQFKAFELATTRAEAKASTETGLSVSTLAVTAGPDIVENDLSSIETVLSLASALYSNLVTDKKWTAKTGKDSKAVLKAEGVKTKSDSKKDDKKKNDANSKKSSGDKKTSSTTPGTSKWRHRKEVEPWEKMIVHPDNTAPRLHKWDPERKRWNAVTKSETPKDSKGGQSKSALSSTANGNETSADDTAKLRAEVVNLKRMLLAVNEKL